MDTRSRERQGGGRTSGKIPWCSAALTVVNIAVFFICDLGADWMYEAGAFSVLYLVRDREYYRLITSMFLHANISHLVNNLLLLYFGGEIVERSMGRIRWLVLYFGAGLCGNLLSAAYELVTGVYYLSVGASGAVFGLIGGLLFLVVSRKNLSVTISVRRMVLMILLSLYSGFSSSGVNNAAHIGGLLSGFLLAFVLCHIGRLPSGGASSQ